MKWYEILAIVLIILFVVYIFGKEIYKKSKGKSDECSCCSMASKRTLNKIRKEISKDKEQNK